MLIPNKHAHPDETVLAAATVVLKELKRRRVIPYGDLREVLGKRVGAVDFLFTPAVSLLYVLGLVEYLPKVDSFEYRGLR
ncbi:ABC-three component system middle component 8 [Nocardia brasiliensis]|uniref:ABC-three component system middle component 8 n=1 Tax=Nocardia brasiliensis TaxID=37326 RepID=UPI002455D7A8|nr:ABC-three component system middle component 8 [Nocardia brasiliensis]